MPFDANGNHIPPDGVIVSIGDKLVPSQHNPLVLDTSASLSMALVRDGRAPMVGPLRMNGFPVSGMQAGADPSDAATVGQIASVYGAQILAANSKATPVDADILPVYDSAAANALKKLTWANIKATLKAYFDPLYTAAGTALPKSGGTMTGKIVLDGNPSSALHAAPKQYVDAMSAGLASTQLRSLMPCTVK